MPLKITIPRKGTETRYSMCACYPSNKLLRITIPVRGRKRTLKEFVHILCNALRITILVRGRKQIRIKIYFRICLYRLKITIPVRGRKLHRSAMFDTFRICRGIKNHNPRKGTETILKLITGMPPVVLKIIIPVRGRKQLVLEAFSLASFS